MTNNNPAQNQHFRPIDGCALSVRLMGAFEVEAVGVPVNIVSKRARALAAFLAMREGNATARSVLAGMLWGERAEEQARASLRQALTELRAAFSGAATQPVQATAETVTWVRGAAWIDAPLVITAAESTDAQTLSAAVGLLRGEFLEGLALGEPGIDQWITTERERFRRASEAILTRLMELAERSGDLSGAALYGQRLLAQDSLQENVHRALMRIYAAQGRHDAALAQYERLRRELAEQLDVAPATESEELARTIRAARRGTPMKPAAKENIAQPSAIEDTPSLVVMPFINLSGDPGREFFADGMTEDIISALSRIRDMLVIARSSSFVYKGRSIRPKDVAHELGVQFVLEGSIRVSGDRVRVNVQLIDSANGNNIWAERYEGSLDDIFAVQDEMTGAIALALEIKLARGDTARVWEGQTRNLRAWEKMVVARDIFQRYTTANTATARRLLEEALQIDPGYSGARALLGITHYWDARFSLTLDQGRSLELGELEAETLLTGESNLAAALVLKGALAFMRGRHDEAIDFGERAVQLLPNDARGLGFLGMFCMYSGQAEQALPLLKAAMRMTPKADSWYRYYVTLTHFWSDDVAAALASAEHYIRQEPFEPYGHMYLAAINQLNGDSGKAAANIRQMKEFAPRFGIANFQRSERYRDPDRLKRILSAVHEASLKT